MEQTATRRAHEQGWLWAAKLLTGVLIFGILVLHLVVNHLVAAEGLLSYADIVAYYANPLIPLMEGFFLVFVVAHALLGVRGIVLDLSPPARAVRLLDGALLAFGLLAVVYGLWLLATIAGRATG
jgi:succinate dehydrogenase hydrophobic anchor subunit